jgi:C-terminal processing protease CtpA/Prc
MPPMANMDIDIPNYTVMVQNTSRTGLVVENLTPQLAEFFGAKNGRGGILVRSVEKGSIAEAAGFKAGDVIIGVNKDPVADLGDWRRAVRNNAGATPFKILREKKEQQVTLKLPEHKRSALGILKFSRRISRSSSTRSNGKSTKRKWRSSPRTWKSNTSLNTRLTKNKSQSP